MFVGHYSTAFAGKAAARAVPLWVLVLAVQLVDVAWSLLVLAGIEKVRIEPGFMAMSALDLHHMPFTHSLEASLAWAVAAGAAYMLARRGAGVWGAAIVAAAVFSHWLLDLIVHTKDLPILLTGEKVGFGLWNNLPAALGLELGLLTLGFALYLRVTRPATSMGRLSPWLLFGILLALQVYNVWGPVPESVPQLALSALAAFLGLTAIAAFVDRTRTPK